MASGTVTTGRRIVRNTSSLFVSRVVGVGATLAVLPMLYDGLGARAFGVWALLGVLVTIASQADLGLGTAQIREVARAHDAEGHRRARAILGLGLLCSLVLGLLGLIGTHLCWPLLARLFHVGDLVHEARDSALWLMAGVLLNQISTPWRSMLAGTQRYSAIAWTSTVTALLAAVLMVIVVRLGGGLAALGASTAAISVIRTMVLVVIAHRGVAWLTPKVRGIRQADIRLAAGYGLPLQVTRTAGVVNLELGQLFVGSSFGPLPVAGLDLGSRLLNVLRLPPDLLFTVLFPFAVTGLTRNGRDWLDNFYLTTTKYVTAFAGTCAAALMVCAEPLIRWWIGEPVPWAAAAVLILAPSYAIGLIAGTATLITRAEGRPGREAWYVLLTLALNLALAPILIRLYGPLGGALSTTIAITVSSTYFCLRFHHVTSRPIAGLLRAVRPGVVAALIAGGCGGLAATYLSEPAGRMGAGLAVFERGVVVLLVAAAVLAATGLVGPAERTWLAARARRSLGSVRTPGTKRPATPADETPIRKDVHDESARH